MSFGGGDNFYTKSPLSPPLSLPFSFHSSPQETPSSFRLSSIIGEEFLTPGPWVENYPTKEIKWRGYIVFFSFPSLHPRPFPLRTYVDQMMKRKKKKKRGEKIGPVCWSCASKKSRFVRPRPAYFYGRKLFFSVSRPDDHFPFQDFSSGHSKSDGNGREHNGHLFSNRIGVIGVYSDGSTGGGWGSGRNFATTLVFLRTLKNTNSKGIYFSKVYNYFQPMV